MQRATARTIAGLSGPYGAQGVAYGFMGWVVIPYLAAAGLSLAAQGAVLAAGGLPWVAKFLVAPLLDHVRGRNRRRPDPRPVAALSAVAAAALVAVTASLAARSGGTASPVAWLSAAWFAHNVALAVQDVAADALAIDAVAAPRRGRAVAAMLAAHHLGAEAVAALALGAVAERFGLAAAGSWAAAGVLLPGLLVLLVPWNRNASTTAEADHDPGEDGLASRLGALLRARATWVTAAAAAGLLAADQITSAASGTFLVGHLGWQVRRIQMVLAPLALVATLAGYLLAYRLADAIGHARAMALGGFLLAVTWGTFALAAPWWGRTGVVEATVAVQAVGTAVFYVGVHTALMDAAPPPVRATAYVLYMAALNLPRAYGPRLAGPMVAAWGYGGTFAACALLQGAATAASFALFRRLRP